MSRRRKMRQVIDRLAVVIEQQEQLIELTRQHLEELRARAAGDVQ